MGRKSFIFLLFIVVVNAIFALPIHFALINDCHGVMEPWGPRDIATLEAPYGGYPRAVYILDSLKSEYPEILIVHAGDVITGDFLSNMTCGYAMYDLWDLAGVEVFAVGNHEFEYSPVPFDSVVGEIDIKLVCSNLDATGFSNLQAAIRPYYTFSFSDGPSSDSIKIAVFGTTTEESDLIGWTLPMDFTDPVQALDTLEMPGDVDAAIALTHLVVANDLLVAEIPWIDAILGGHDHSLYDEPHWAIVDSDSTPVVKAGAYNRSVGHLTMDYTPEEGLSYVSWETFTLDSTVPEDSIARVRLDEYRDMIIANPAVGLDPYNTVAFTAESSIVGYSRSLPDSGWRDTPLGNLVTDAYLEALHTDIAVEGRGALRMWLNPGPITYADLFRAMPVGRDLITGLNSPMLTLEFTGTQLKQIIEISLFASSLVSEGVPVWAGMKLSYNPDGPLYNKVDVSSWYIGDSLWEATKIYSLTATTVFQQVLDIYSYPYTSIDTSEITAYKAIVDYCTDSSFNPDRYYRSDGRQIDLVASQVEIAKKPDKYKLEVYPNPFNASCKISFHSAKKGNFRLEIIDILGKIVFKKDIRSQGGNTIFIWNPNNSLASGVYLINIPKLNICEKAILLR